MKNNERVIETWYFGHSDTIWPLVRASLIKLTLFIVCTRIKEKNTLIKKAK